MCSLTELAAARPVSRAAAGFNSSDAGVLKSKLVQEPGAGQVQDQEPGWTIIFQLNEAVPLIA